MKTACVVLALSLAASCTCWAVPQLINYQGYLTRPDGTPLDTTVSMTFRLYPDSVAGTPLWIEVRADVPVVGGLFIVRLGEFSALSDAVLDNPQVWLSIAVGADVEMTPRSRVVSVAYSYRAGTVDGATGGTVSGGVTITGQVCEGSGSSNAGQGAFASGTNCDAIADGSTISGGMNNEATGDFSVIAGGGENDAQGVQSTIGGGYGNVAAGTYGTIAGGYHDKATGGYSAVGGGRYNAAQGEYSVVAGGGGSALADSNSAIGDYSTVGGGSRNIAQGIRSVVAGGGGNLALGTNSTIGGGYGHEVTSSYATVAGGYNHTAAGAYSTISGGKYNRAAGDFAVVAGGGGTVPSDSNSARADYSTVSGGFRNLANATFTVVSGGSTNTAGSSFSTAGGGYQNTAGGYGSTVAGGRYNAATSRNAMIGGGENNAASDTGAAVCGGRYNNARGDYSFVGGGGGSLASDSNSALGKYAVISGGTANAAIGRYSVVGGGESNTVNIAGWHSVVGGGDANTINYEYSVIGGGTNNTIDGGGAVIGGGSYNHANTGGTVPGGYANDADTLHTFAAGCGSYAHHPGAFVWGHCDGGGGTESWGDNTFTVRCRGGARFYTSGLGESPGVWLPGLGGAWQSLCDVNQKRLHGLVNTSEILARVSTLPLHRWSYKQQNDSVQHIGPTAQDFRAAFGLGDDDKSISTLDPDGIALAAIQELAKRLQNIEAQNAALRARVQSLEANTQATLNRK